ncbi:MAG: type II toxin-antitoxin system VapC family toxin [Magnetococcus sp. YQC-5]
MKVVMDTHAFLWWIDQSSRLSDKAHAVLADQDNDVLLSMASVWELAIKMSIGKIDFNCPFDIFITHELKSNNFNLLNLSIYHLKNLIFLPFHHRDPFDRLLISQALVENIPILTADRVFDSYGVMRLW